MNNHVDEDEYPVDEKTKYARERTRLAHERTFLAWIRTGIACVASGVVVVRFMFFQNQTHVFIANFTGIFLIFCGILIFLLALLDYRKSLTELGVSGGGYLGSIWAITSIVAILTFISILLCFIV